MGKAHVARHLGKRERLLKQKREASKSARVERVLSLQGMDWPSRVTDVPLPNMFSQDGFDDSEVRVVLHAAASLSLTTLRCRPSVVGLALVHS